MKTVVETIIETNEYKVKIDVEDDATEDEIRDIIEEAYLEDDCNMRNTVLLDLLNLCLRTKTVG